MLNPRTMKALLKSQGFRESLLFAGLLLAALTISAFVAEPSFATSLISPSDNPAAIAGATGGEGSFRSFIMTIVNFALGFLGLVAVLMVIYGGFLYLSSAGDEGSAKKGKTVILYAVIGIILIFASFALINTVLQAGLGTDAAAT